MDDIVSLGKALGLEVDASDVQELVEEHDQEPATDELLDPHTEQQKGVEEIPSGEEERGEESLTSREIKEMCKKWEAVQSFVQNHHPNKAVAGRCMNLFNDKAMSPFREILKRRQRQVSLDRFLEKLAPKESSNPKLSEPEPGLSEAKRPRREPAPEIELPATLTEGDSPSKQ